MKGHGPSGDGRGRQAAPCDGRWPTLPSDSALQRSSAPHAAAAAGLTLSRGTAVLLDGNTYVVVGFDASHREYLCWAGSSTAPETSRVVFVPASEAESAPAGGEPLHPSLLPFLGPARAGRSMRTGTSEASSPGTHISEDFNERQEFVLGAKLTVMGGSGVRRECTITDTDVDRVKIHFDGFDHGTDEWLLNSSSRILSRQEGMEIVHGSRLIVVGPSGIKRDCTVRQVADDRVKISYHGFDSSNDEWLMKDSDRIVTKLEDCASPSHGPSRQTSQPPSESPSRGLPRSGNSRHEELQQMAYAAVDRMELALEQAEGASPSRMPIVGEAQQQAFVGLSIIVVSPSGARRDCTIVDIEGGMLRIHYEGFDSSTDEWISIGSDRILIRPERLELVIGGKLMVVSPSGIRRECTILDVFRDMVQVHYDDFDKSYDEWLPADSERIVAQFQADDVVPFHAQPLSSRMVSARGQLSTCVGLQLTVVSPSGVRRECRVVSEVGDMIEVHFDGFDDSHDEWLSKTSDRILVRPQLLSLHINQKLVVTSPSGVRRECTVMDVYKDMVKIHYDGFDDDNDEWLSTDSERIVALFEEDRVVPLRESPFATPAWSRQSSVANTPISRASRSGQAGGGRVSGASGLAAAGAASVVENGRQWTTAQALKNGAIGVKGSDSIGSLSSLAPAASQKAVASASPPLPPPAGSQGKAGHVGHERHGGHGRKHHGWADTHHNGHHHHHPHGHRREKEEDSLQSWLHSPWVLIAAFMAFALMLWFALPFWARSGPPAVPAPSPAPAAPHPALAPTPAPEPEQRQDPEAELERLRDQLSQQKRRAAAAAEEARQEQARLRHEQDQLERAKIAEREAREESQPEWAQAVQSTMGGGQGHLWWLLAALPLQFVLSLAVGALGAAGAFGPLQLVVGQRLFQARSAFAGVSGLLVSSLLVCSSMCWALDVFLTWFGAGGLGFSYWACATASLLKGNAALIAYLLWAALFGLGLKRTQMQVQELAEQARQQQRARRRAARAAAAEGADPRLLRAGTGTSLNSLTETEVTNLTNQSGGSGTSWMSAASILGWNSCFSDGMAGCGRGCTEPAWWGFEHCRGRLLRLPAIFEAPGELSGERDDHSDPHASLDADTVGRSRRARGGRDDLQRPLLEDVPGDAV